MNKTQKTVHSTRCKNMGGREWVWEALARPSAGGWRGWNCGFRLPLRILWRLVFGEPAGSYNTQVLTAEDPCPKRFHY